MTAAEEEWTLPSAGHVLGCIEEWRALDLREATDDEIEKRLLDFRDKLGRMIGLTKHYRPSTLWRVRKAKKEDISLRSQLLYPRPHVAPLSRCCRAGCPVLYVSPYLSTCLEEVGVTVGDAVVVIRYAALSQLSLARIIGEFHPRDVVANKELFSSDDLLAYQVMREFIRTEFTKPVGSGTEFLYRLSAAICRVFAEDASADGWIYPSVQQPTHENIAIKPSSADHKLDISKVGLYQVMSTDHFYSPPSATLYPGFDLACLAEAKLTGDDVEWRDSVGNLGVMRFE